MKNYYVKSEKYFLSEDAETTKVLPSGMYFMENDDRSWWLEKEDFTSDAIIDLPDKNFQHILNEFEVFLKPETKQKFKDYGFLYKRSTLLYGKPGTGKTCLVQRLSKEVLKKDAIVIFDPIPHFLPKLFFHLNKTQPDQLVVLVFEEFDKLFKNGNQQEGLLTLLDGQAQKNNVIYLLTTNYIENIPKRVLRPGRISTTMEIHFPDADVREYYLNLKLTPKDKHTYSIKELVQKTEGLSIDQLTEVVKSVMCLGMSVDQTIHRIQSVGESEPQPEVD